MTVPLNDSVGIRIDLRKETGEIEAQSAVLKSQDLLTANDYLDIPLGTDWVINVGVVLGLCPSSAFSNSTSSSSVA